MIQTGPNILEQKIHFFAEKFPQKIAIKGDVIADSKIDNNFTYQQLLIEIDSISDVLQLSVNKYQTFALIMNNHPAWAILDLALMFKLQCCVPLPAFFSKDQTKHSILDANVDHLLIECDVDGTPKQDINNFLEEYFQPGIKISIANKQLFFFSLKSKYKVRQPDENRIQKITYTSGTTDKPKGVMLSQQAIMTKVEALAEASEANENDIALSILPLSTLLENIAGLYVPLYCGAQTTLLSPQSIGISGSSQIDAKQLMSTLHAYQPSVFIIIPQLLLLFINLLKSAYKLPDSIRFIAMGGAPIAKDLLLMAQQLDIPVFEGYGLSEASSVVAVNTPSNYRIGSVGKILKTHQIKLSADSEILIKDHLFDGYLNKNNHISDDYYATGDIGEVDEDGFIYITGRKKNIINTAYGRNISPEWIEKELEAIPMVSQSLIYGHGKPFLVALVVLRIIPNLTHEEIISQLEQSLVLINSKLPDYASITNYIEIVEPFSIQNNQLTGTGRPRREVIYETYENNLNLYYANYGEFIMEKLSE